MSVWLQVILAIFAATNVLVWLAILFSAEKGEERKALIKATGKAMVLIVLLPSVLLLLAGGFADTLFGNGYYQRQKNNGKAKAEK